MNKYNYRIILCLLISSIIGIRLFWTEPGLLAYLLTAGVLGLRHGLDADHIVVIDNITRKLINENKPSSTTGLFFAAGHSTIVFIMTLAVLLGLSQAHGYLQKINQFGSNFGPLVSIVFLTITLILNLLMIVAATQNNKISGQIEKSFCYRIVNRYFFNNIDNPRKMYFVGFLFGLGFDTATEVSLLAMAATSLLQGLNIYSILLLPIGFACGMIITDTINSTFMSKIYSQIQNNQQQLKLYNYFILAFASMVTLLVILIELAQYLEEQLAIHFSLLSMISKFGDYSEIIGSSIAGIFVIFGFIIYSTLNKHKV